MRKCLEVCSFGSSYSPNDKNLHNYYVRFKGGVRVNVSKEIYGKIYHGCLVTLDETNEVSRVWKKLYGDKETHQLIYEKI